MLALWLFCPLFAVELVYRQIEPTEIISVEDLSAAVTTRHAELQPTVRDPNTTLTTDFGRGVPTLLVPGDDRVPTLAQLTAQDHMLDQRQLHDLVIQLPLGWENCNCHGFVFTAGHHWIAGTEVEGILRDNGYQPVTVVHASDLAVYRDRTGTIMHTGIVRGLAADNVVLVESKWGQAGRFIHRHDRHPYLNTECIFYRSARAGHLLRGLYPSAPEHAPAPLTGVGM